MEKDIDQGFRLLWELGRGEYSDRKSYTIAKEFTPAYTFKRSTEFVLEPQYPQYNAKQRLNPTRRTST